jgi:nucleotidyltransferase substrate binding protein (TIGR01987 family)
MMNAYVEPLVSSVARLREVLAAERTIANRDSAIKRFELTFELSWKALQSALRKQGFVCRSPREALRAAMRCGMLPNDEAWLALMDDRNETVHTYDETVAEQVYERLPAHSVLFDELLKVLQQQPE